MCYKKVTKKNIQILPSLFVVLFVLHTCEITSTFSLKHSVTHQQWWQFLHPGTDIFLSFALSHWMRRRVFLSSFMKCYDISCLSPEILPFLHRLPIVFCCLWPTSWPTPGWPIMGQSCTSLYPLLLCHLIHTTNGKSQLRNAESRSPSVTVADQH